MLSLNPPIWCCERWPAAVPFGRPGVNKGERSAFPQARLVALVECGTHAMFDAEIGTYATSEMTLAKRLVDRLKPDMVLLADRGFAGFALWEQASATGADLIWRARNKRDTPPDRSPRRRLLAR